MKEENKFIRTNLIGRIVTHDKARVHLKEDIGGQYEDDTSEEEYEFVSLHLGAIERGTHVENDIALATLASFSFVRLDDVIDIITKEQINKIKSRMTELYGIEFDQ